MITVAEMVTKVQHYRTLWSNAVICYDRNIGNKTQSHLRKSCFFFSFFFFKTGILGASSFRWWDVVRKEKGLFIATREGTWVLNCSELRLSLPLLTAHTCSASSKNPLKWPREREREKKNEFWTRARGYRRRHWRRCCRGDYLKEALQEDGGYALDTF